MGFISFVPAYAVYATKIAISWRASYMYTKKSRAFRSDLRERIEKSKDMFAHCTSPLSFEESCIDYGLITLITVPPAIALFFWMAMCAKLDEPDTSFSWFVILLPVWAFFVFAFILAILHGLASKNNRATRVEKILISALIPAGFAVSCVLIVLRLEGTLQVRFS